MPIAVRPAAQIADQGQLDTLECLVNYQKWIVAEFAPYLSGRAVEYGAGIGTMSALLRPHVDEFELVEPHEASFRTLAARFEGVAGTRVSHDTVERQVRDTPAGHYDSIVMINVLEHVEDDRNILAELYRVLRPGGALCLFVPAHQFLYSAYDRLVGHCRRYELPAMRQLVRGPGFEIARSGYFDFSGVLPWFLIMRLMGNTTIKPTAARLYDTVVVPAGRVLESFISPPIGKNIVLIARRSMAEN